MCLTTAPSLQLLTLVLKYKFIFVSYVPYSESMRLFHTTYCLEMVNALVFLLMRGVEKLQMPGGC